MVSNPSVLKIRLKAINSAASRASSKQEVVSKATRRGSLSGWVVGKIYVSIDR